MPSSVPVMLRTSERTTFTRCRMKWHWAYNEKLKAKQTSAPLRFGTLVHDALAEFYRPGKKRGPLPAKTFNKLYKTQLTELQSFNIVDEEGKWEEAGDLGNAMLTHYIETYGKDEHLEVIAPELAFQIDVTDSKGKVLFTYVGTFDAVIKDHSKRRPQLGLFEHKTAKTIQTSHLWSDEQAGSYWAYAPDWLKSQGVLGPNDNLDFMLYNFMRKAKKDERPHDEHGRYLNQPTKDVLLQTVANQGINVVKSTVVAELKTMLDNAGVNWQLLGEVSKDQPPAYFHRETVMRDAAEGANLMQRVKQQAREMKLVRAGKLDVYKNFMPDCARYCEFRDLCELHETNAPGVKSFKKAMFTTWDPYGDHTEEKDEGD